jgi:catechol 2,3-dioxygenase-like lactoylglutathione lyase family enzyme
MRTFYTELFDFRIRTERTDVIAFDAGAVTLCLRQRTRAYDGQPRPAEAPGVQLAFRVAPGDVARCHEELVRRGVTILEPPTDQFWGHRTVFFRDPEGNILEIYADL